MVTDAQRQARLSPALVVAAVFGAVTLVCAGVLVGDQEIGDSIASSVAWAIGTATGLSAIAVALLSIKRAIGRPNGSGNMIRMSEDLLEGQASMNRAIGELRGQGDAHYRELREWINRVRRTADDAARSAADAQRAASHAESASAQAIKEIRAVKER